MRISDQIMIKNLKTHLIFPMVQVLDNLAVGLGIGMALGFAVGTVLDSKKRK